MVQLLLHIILVLLLAMAQWFKDRITANDYTKNFPYFYSGGVAQSPLNNQPPGSTVV